MAIAYRTLKSNEFVGLSAIEISSFPHIDILHRGSQLENEIINEYKKEFISLLNEIYQLYKTTTNDISLEILWKSTEIENQPFKANIRVFLIIRSIGDTQDSVNKVIESIINLCSMSLLSKKYKLKSVEHTELEGIIQSIKDEKINALVKEEKIENLQNPILPLCYSYDRFPKTDNDLSRIVNVLTNNPDCALSIQLIPLNYYENELSEIDRIAQALSTLSKGVMEQGVGSISFAMAEKHAENYYYYSEHKHLPLYGYNIIVCGTTSFVNNMAGKLYGQISSAEEAPIEIKNVNLKSNEIRKDSNLFPLPWAVNELLLHKERNTAIWSSGNFSNALYRLPYIITSEEAAELFRLPIGTDRVSAGLNINESEQNSKTYMDNVINSGDICIGNLKSSSKNDAIGISLNDLAKHMLVVGTPGSGKTTFSVGLLDRLWKEHNIPFLVIEPAKNEYRALVQSFPDLQVFTPGKNFVSPFVFNPFVPPKNVKLETYKSTLKTAFAAGVSMSTPLDKIFEETINNCYSDFRWLDTYTTDNQGKIFNISDFIKCFQETFDEIGYTGDAKNIGRAGIVRLNSLVNLFDNYFSIPIEDILTKPTVIELAAIENADQKALIIALLLLSILAYVNANFVGEGKLSNIILLEEAHVLLDAETNSGQGDANPSAIAQGLVKRMLAELRAYGVGLVIADQSPKKVGTDVVALTDIKMVFRLVEGVDKEIIANSTGMSEIQTLRMGKLKPGEAFMFFNKLDEPEEIITPNYRLENDISISLSDDGIKTLSKYWDSRQRYLRPYPECECIRFCSNACDYNQRVLAREIVRRIFNKKVKTYVNNNPKIVASVYARLSEYIKDELNDEEYTEQLFSCVKVHFFRKIKYLSSVRISDETIKSLLEK